jgi:hypothetical protein
MDDRFVMLLQVFGRCVDGSASKDLYVVCSDRLARAPRGSAALAERHLRKRVRQGRRYVVGVLRNRSVFEGLIMLFCLCYIGQDACFVVQTSRRRRERGRRARHGADIALLLCLDSDVGQC